MGYKIIDNVDGYSKEVKKVEMVKLDDEEVSGCTFLKADVESYEYRLLLGARKTIQQYKPKLSICIYHNAVDLFSIPLLIKELNPSYNIYIRHHSYEQKDTVVYAC